jgi:hypothetical protein
MKQKNTDFFKNKPYDLSSKFSGTTQDKTPWYLKTKQQLIDQGMEPTGYVPHFKKQGHIA